MFNMLGGMNTVAQLHDDFLMQTFGTVARNPGIWNGLSMVPCAGVAYGANYDNFGFGVR